MVIMKTKSKKAGSQTGSMTFETHPPISDAGTDVKHLASEIRSLSAAGSILTIAVAGPPGSGKSTFSAALATQIGPSCCVVPMDGFHLDNSVLQDRGLLARKGAPDTFDCAGFSHLVDDLKRGSGTIFPTFDRDSDSVVPAGGHVPAGTTVLLFEGNYLLFDETGWRDLAAKWDAAIWLDVPPAILEARLIRRWRDQGMSEADATARAKVNDLTNARHVIDKALPAKWTVSN